MRRALAVLGAALLTVACGSKAEEPPKSDLGTATANAANDTAVMGEVQTAVNEVLRAGTDCAVIKPAAEVANRKIAEARSRVKTPSGTATLDAQAAQVKNIAQLCP